MGEEEEISGDTPDPGSILLHRHGVLCTRDTPQNPGIRLRRHRTLFCHPRGGGNPGKAPSDSWQRGFAPLHFPVELAEGVFSPV